MSTKKQKDLASTIAGGLGGWLQLQAAQGLHELHGEDTAQFQLMQILYSRHQWRLEPSAKPNNWLPNKKHRVDVAMRAWGPESSTWYGVIEVKWPGTAVDRRKERRRLIHDVLRATSVETSNLKVSFVVLGGSSEALARLFDHEHDDNEASDTERRLLGVLLKRDLAKPSGSLTEKQLNAVAPDWQARVPAKSFKVNNRISAVLLARADANLGGKTLGHVFVWQCNNGRGRPGKGTTSS